MKAISGNLTKTERFFHLVTFYQNNWHRQILSFTLKVSLTAKTAHPPSQLSIQGESICGKLRADVNDFYRIKSHHSRETAWCDLDIGLLDSCDLFSNESAI